MITIKDQDLEVTIKKLGAEMHSIKYKGFERLHQDMAVWPRQSPVMFPMIGKTKDDYYNYLNNRYEMPNVHGFARLKLFNVIKHNENSCIMELLSDAETYQMYPFKFSLKVYYEVNDNALSTKWEVTNLDNQKMYFTIGGHPGFNYNMGSNETYLDAIVSFDEPIPYQIYGVNNSLISDKKLIQKELVKELRMDTEIKKYNIVIFDQVPAVTLKSKISNHFIRLELPNIPYLAFWQSNIEKPPFICLEPWCGLPDYENSNHDFAMKKTNIVLPKNEKYINGYKIIIG